MSIKSNGMLNLTDQAPTDLQHVCSRFLPQEVLVTEPVIVGVTFVNLLVGAVAAGVVLAGAVVDIVLAGMVVLDVAVVLLD